MFTIHLWAVLYFCDGEVTMTHNPTLRYSFLPGRLLLSMLLRGGSAVQLICCAESELWTWDQLTNGVFLAIRGPQSD